MLDLIEPYWPHILFVLSVLMGAAAAIHAAMTKEEVRSAIGWVGVIVLSPIVGALLYLVAGINRIRRSVISDRRALLQGKSARMWFPTTRRTTGSSRISDTASGR